MSLGLEEALRPFREEGGSSHADQRTAAPMVIRHLSSPANVPDTPATPATQIPPTVPLYEDALLPTPAATANPGGPVANTGAPIYWPRKLLDTGPAPLAPIILPPPDGSNSLPQGHAIMELFIHADGQVDRIEVIESDAPTDFIDAAKATFQATRFTPGLKDNVPVPSRIKIEVRYE